MTTAQAAKFKDRLEKLAARVRDAAADLEASARMPTGGEAGGNISNTPMHLGDVGTAVYTQELNATLLENEEYILAEAQAALGRIAAGTFGVCERCGKGIPAERLDALPYTRYCTACSAAVNDGVAVNLNAGRPRSFDEGTQPHDRGGRPRGGKEEVNAEAGPARKRPLKDPDAPARKEILFTDLETPPAPDRDDVHAAGTAGGGTAVGGLAGTNIGDGSPVDGNLADAMGSGNFDVGLEADDPKTDGYSGSAGGAVGGSPAGKRVKGGKAADGRK